MSNMTITEALASIKTLVRRIEMKRSAIAPYLFRLDSLKDPLEQQGGSSDYVRREMQAILDLQDEIVRLRVSIAHTNSITFVSVSNIYRTVEEWLVWRRDVAPMRLRILEGIRSNLDRARGDERTIRANFDESAMLDEYEIHQTIMLELDGALSRINAVTSLLEAELEAVVMEPLHIVPKG